MYIYGVFRRSGNEPFGSLCCNNTREFPALFHHLEEAVRLRDEVSVLHPEQTYFIYKFELNPNGIRTVYDWYVGTATEEPPENVYTLDMTDAQAPPYGVYDRLRVIEEAWSFATLPSERASTSLTPAVQEPEEGLT